jgi:hypothetical protein
MNAFLTHTARFLGIVAAASGAATCAMAVSLPYRIGQGIYTWYLWTERLIPFTLVTALVAMVFALTLGIIWRQRLPIALAIVSFVLVSFSVVYRPVQSGPNPQAWCYNNLRKIEAAKLQFASEKQLTNGAAITGGEISKYIEGGFDTLECAEHGQYTIGAIGTESRCSIHGSISEMERGWQKEMPQ